MQVKYVPEVCREIVNADGTAQAPTFAGDITLRVPSFDERYEFLEMTGIEVADSGGVSKRASNITILRNMVKGSEKFYVDVNIKRLSDGKEFKSFESMTLDPKCDPILTEIAKEVQSGFGLSKN